jgi:ribosome hibernation promoting factor
MRLELTGRHVDITPTLRRLVDAKLAKLERLLNDSAVSAQAVLTREKYRLRTEITLHARGEKFLHGVGHSSAWEGSLTQAVDKITQQAQRVKGKWQGRKRHGMRRVPGPPETLASASPASERGVRPHMPRIFRSSRQALKAMSVAEAARAIDTHGDGLIIFRDTERSSISVLYRRQNGELALVETEA